MRYPYGSISRRLSFAACGALAGYAGEAMGFRDGGARMG